MQKPVVIIGIGEMAGVFARGLLRTGHPVYPITRDMDLEEEAKAIPEPLFVLVAVAENDLHPTLEKLPSVWKDKVALLQNELLPRDWQKHGFDNLTAISVWFEKKKGQDAKVLIPSPAYGPHAQTLVDALTVIDIAAKTVSTPKEMTYELVRKNVYILTTNISGLETGGNVAELWQNHEAFARNVASDIMDLQEWLTGESVPREKLIEGMLEAFKGDPEHKCMGRSAPARLQRALNLAESANLKVDHLQEIANKHLQ